MVQDEQEKWDIVIKPRSGLFRLDLEEVWRYRDLLVMYIRRDIVTFYKQTVLGPLWFVIQPLLTTVMFMFVFGGIAGIPTDGLPQPLFYMAGLLCWNYFSECLSRCSDTFNANQNVFGKVYFPRLVVPLSIVISCMIKMGIQFGLFVLIYIYYLCNGYSLMVNGYAWLAPLLLLRSWFGVRIIDILLDDQIPRLAFLDYFRGAVVDVCHSGYLPFVRDEAEP